MSRKATSAMKMINSMFEAECMDAKELSAKAKMLLGSYRHVCWASIGFCRVGLEEKYMICDEDIDRALSYLVEFSPREDKRVFESNLKALFDSKWMMELVDDSMIQVKEFPDMGDVYFDLLSKFYLSKFKYSENEMLEMLNMERSTYYDRKKEAVLVFAWALWGTVLPKTLFMIEDVDQDLDDFDSPD